MRSYRNYGRCLTRTLFAPNCPDCELLATAVRGGLESLEEIESLRLDAQAWGHTGAERLVECASHDIVETVQAGVETLLIHLVSHGY